MLLLNKSSSALKYLEKVDQTSKNWKIVYTIFKSPMFGDKDWCVFSSVEPLDYEYSSTNAVEEMIMKMIEEEGLSVENTRFFDLQTFSFYRKKASGEFEFDEITNFDDSTHWSPVTCPPEVYEVFVRFIGTGNIRVNRTYSKQNA